MRPADDNHGPVIPLVAEDVTVTKTAVPTHRVRIQTHVDTISETLTGQLAYDYHDIERVPIDAVVEIAPVIREEGDTLIVPVLKERVIVTKQIVLVEEIRLRRVRGSNTVSVPVERRVMRATVEREAIRDSQQKGS